MMNDNRAPEKGVGGIGEFEINTASWMLIFTFFLLLTSFLGVLTGMVIGWGAGVIAGVAVGLGIGEFLWAILEVLGGWM